MTVVRSGPSPAALVTRCLIGVRVSRGSGSPCRHMAVLCVALALIVPPSASAHFSTTEYARFTQNCTSLDNLADPMGIVFYGFDAYAETHGFSHRVFDLLDNMSDPDHTWGNTSGGIQYAGGHTCTQMERQIATGSGTRYHIRLNQTYHRDELGRFEAVGTPHFERSDCGTHVVDAETSPLADNSGYDLGRGHIKNDWLAEYGSDMRGDIQDWGNTRDIQQCRGAWTADSAGRVYWLKTHDF
jgi:hypothetical protein